MHKQVIHDLDAFFEYPVERIEVLLFPTLKFTSMILKDNSLIDPTLAIMMKKMGIIGSFYINSHDVIAVNEVEIRRSDSIVDEEDNVTAEANKDDLYETIAHEYFHAIFHRDYFDRIKSILGSKSLSKGIKDSYLKGVNEAFAYWASESLTTRDLFSKADLEAYEGNAYAMVKFYNLFKDSERKHGKSYVLNNLVSLVGENCEI